MRDCRRLCFSKGRCCSRRGFSDRARREPRSSIFWPARARDRIHESSPVPQSNAIDQTLIRIPAPTLHEPLSRGLTREHDLETAVSLTRIGPDVVPLQAARRRICACRGTLLQRCSFGLPSNRSTSSALMPCVSSIDCRSALISVMWDLPSRVCASTGAVAAKAAAVSAVSSIRLAFTLSSQSSAASAIDNDDVKLLPPPCNRLKPADNEVCTLAHIKGCLSGARRLGRSYVDLRLECGNAELRSCPAKFCKSSMPLASARSRESSALIRPARARELDSPSRPRGIERPFEAHESRHVVSGDPDVIVGR